MQELLDSLEERFSLKAFFLGLAMAAVICASVTGILFALQGRTNNMLQSRLDSQTVVIEHITIPSAHPAPLETSKTQEPPVHASAAPMHTEPAPEQEPAPPVETGQPARQALSEAPADGLFEDVSEGILPVAGADGNTPFKAYRKPFLLNRDRPAVAIAVLDYGLSAALSDSMLSDLPGEVSLILNPYATDPDKWQKSARENGHELWLQAMFETGDFPKHDPGAQALMTKASLKYNQDRYLWALSRTTGYVGLAAFTDKTLENAQPIFENIAADIFRRGLGYFELSPERYSYFEPKAIDAGKPAAHANFLVEDLSPESAMLSQITQHISAYSGAVLIVKPSPVNLKNLKAWIESLQEKGLQIAPISAVAALNADE